MRDGRKVWHEGLENLKEIGEIPMGRKTVHISGLMIFELLSKMRLGGIYGLSNGIISK